MWILEPKKIWKLGRKGLWISLHLNMTNLYHLLFSFGLCFIGYGFAFGALIWKELGDGYGTDNFFKIGGCKEGIDGLDLMGGLAGIFLHVYFDMKVFF